MQPQAKRQSKFAHYTRDQKDQRNLARKGTRQQEIRNRGEKRKGKRSIESSGGERTTKQQPKLEQALDNMADGYMIGWEAAQDKFRVEQEKHAQEKATMRDAHAKNTADTWTDARNAMYHEGFWDGVKKCKSDPHFEPRHSSPIVIGRRKRRA